MNENFKVGDVVQLKSGGPEMTVKKINASAIERYWFNSELKHSVFEPNTLKISA